MLDEFVGGEIRSKLEWKWLLSPQALLDCGRRGVAEMCTDILRKLWVMKPKPAPSTVPVLCICRH